MGTELPLNGKTALVTAGADGFGMACAAALLRDGATVLLMGRRRDALEQGRQQLCEQMPHANVHIYAGNTCRASDVQAALKQAWWLNSRLDIVVPTVGSDGSRPLLQHDEASFRSALELQVVSAFLAIRHAAPLMTRQGGGSIVCVSSRAAHLDFKRLSADCTARAALEALVRAAAEELSSAGIRINAVRPGLTQTDAIAPMFDDPALPDAFREPMPPDRPSTPEDIAAAVRYLAGPESAWVTGQNLAVDGVNALRKHPNPDGAVRHFHGATAWQAASASQMPTAG